MIRSGDDGWKPNLFDLVDGMHPDEVRAWAARESPKTSILLITGEEFSFADLIAEAERLHEQGP